MKSEISKNELTIRIGVGVFGYVIHDRVSDLVSELIQDNAIFCAGTPQDLRAAQELGFPYLKSIDIKGTYYKKEMIKTLIDHGFTLHYLDQAITSENDISAVNQQNDREAQAKLNPDGV